jgi:HSP20 family protein
MLMRFDPFREFDRVAQESFRPSRMPMDAYRRGDVVVVHFDLPGVDPDTIDLTADQNTLTVTAERTWPAQEEDELIVSERLQGTYSRQLMLGDNLNADQITARYDQGVLTVKIPVAAESKSRKVQVEHGGKPATVEAASPTEQGPKHGMFHRQ